MDKAKIAQAIALLQQILSGSAQEKPQFDFSPLASTHHKFTEAFAAAQQLHPQLRELNRLVGQGYEQMRKILENSLARKAPTDEQKKKVIEEFDSLKSKAIDLEKASKQHAVHATSVRNYLDAFKWVISTVPEMQIQSSLQTSEFYANKFRVNKVLPVNNWIKLLIQALKELKTYALKEFKAGITFSGSQPWSESVAAQAKAEEKKPQLKKEESCKTEKAKARKQQWLKNGYFLMNGKDEKITFKEQQVGIDKMFNFENCTNCTFIIPKKCNSAQLSNCTNSNLVIDSCISELNINNCDKVNLQVLKHAPSVSVDKCQAVRIILPNPQVSATQVLSSNVNQLNISYVDESGEESSVYNVPSQFVTQFNSAKKAFTTKVFAHM